jgi:thymidylate kinase
VRVIALEGPSFAGKSTAIAALSRDPSLGRIAVFDCYVREITDAQDIPPARTADRAEQIAAFLAFMAVEERRMLRTRCLAAEHEPPQLVILDRSVDTLLAHAHALDTLYGFGARAEALALLPHLPHLVPERTFYLDAPAETLRRRRAALDGHSGSEDYFLHDPGFLGPWRGYFLGAAGPTLTPAVVAVPADAPPNEVAERIRGLL